MTRDFKQNESTMESSQYGLSWVLGGIAVGLLAGAVAYALMSKQDLSSLVNFGNQTAQSAPSPSNIASSTGDTTPASLQDRPVEDDRPGFSYHAVLPQLELDVAIPAPREAAPERDRNNQLVAIDLSTPVAAEEQQPETGQQQAEQAQQLAQGNYMFQLGAYRNQQQAAQMQQKAKRNGMNTRVETATVNGQTWYRVRLGPTNNLQVVDRWKQRLSGMGITPMIIRM